MLWVKSVNHLWCWLLTACEYFFKGSIQFSFKVRNGIAAHFSFDSQLYNSFHLFQLLMLICIIIIFPAA